MIVAPSENTVAALTLNESRCFSCEECDGAASRQSFRLYLPSFPASEVRATLEVPFLLARRFSLGLEAFLSRTVSLLTQSCISPMLLALHIAPRFIIVDSVYKTDLKNFIKINKSEYTVKNIYNMKVEIFHNIPAITRNCLIENCKSLLEMQNNSFAELIGCIYVSNQNLFIRITEHYYMDLEFINNILSNDKHTLDTKFRADVAIFILAEMLICLNDIHERGIIHRSICPANFVITSRGHLKIRGLFEAMNRCRNIKSVYDKCSTPLENNNNNNNNNKEMFDDINHNYLDPEVLRYFLQNNIMGGYMELNCLSDVFSIAVIIIETLFKVNLLDIKMWNDFNNALFLPNFNYFNLVEIYLNPQMQIILRERLSNLCGGFITNEVYAFILLMLQPKVNRMKGLRLNVQRHTFLNSSGCEYKLRLELVKKHPAFNNLNMDNIFFEDSQVTKLLNMFHNF